MTIGDIDSCTTAGGMTKGWRYCHTNPNPLSTEMPYGEASNPYDTHDSLFDYWATGNVSQVLGATNRGRQILMPGVSGSSINSKNTQFIWGGDGGVGPPAFQHDLAPGLGAINSGDVIDAAALGARVQQLLTSPQGQPNPPLRMGDYIFINTNPTHGLLVIGWQKAQDCSIALQGTGNPLRHWEINDFAESYSAAQLLGIPNSVPYVADFTSPFVNNPTPRPFYCTRYVDTISNPNPNQPSFFSVHNWKLFTIPESVTLHVNDLYFDNKWGW